MKFTITNSFHHTEYTLYVADDMVLSPRQVKRCRRALCGIIGCTCGDAIGGRDSEYFAVPTGPTGEFIQLIHKGDEEHAWPV